MDSLNALLPYLYMLMRVLAIACFIHALMTRQQTYWMVMLGLGALLGSFFGLVLTLVYAIQVFFPWLRGRGRVAGQAVSRGVEAMRPLEARIRDAQAQLEESDTHQNRTTLAELQARAGQLSEAQATLQPLLSGIYKDDPVVLLTSAELALARQQPAEAEAILQRIALKTSSATRTRTLTLLAAAQEQQQKPEADATYREAMLGASTEEPRARYAAYLISQQKPAEARAVLEAMQKTEQKASKLYRKQEREWFALAASLRKELGG